MEALCRLSQIYAPLLGRILLSFIYLQSAYEKIFHSPQTVALLIILGIGSGPLSLRPGTEKG